jgi:hypothetical protein
MKRGEPRTSYYMFQEGKPWYGVYGTWIEDESICYPSGSLIRRAKVLCPDGKLRIMYTGIPDTYFSLPVKGNKGYITSFYMKEMNETNENVWVFIPYKKEGEPYVTMNEMVKTAIQRLKDRTKTNNK